MQNKRTTSAKLLGALLAGALCATPVVVTTAQAAPNQSHHQSDRNSRQDNNRNDRRNDRQNDSRDNRRDNGRNDNQRNRYQTLTGIVTDVERGSFDFRVGNKEYEVHPSGSLPSGLSRNDQVRVYGQVDDDDIRNANVSIIRNNDRGNNGNNGWGSNKYQTITGTVENVNGNTFDLKANNKTYRVRLSGGAPKGLSKKDVVRVYGQVFGSNDIRNANVAMVRNR